MGLLFQIDIVGAPLLLIIALIMQRVAARGSRFSRVQRAIASLAVIATVVPGVWLVASGNLRSEFHENALWVLTLLLIPIALALPSVFSRLSIRTLSTAAGAFVLVAFCFISGFSIGIAYLPAAALLLLAGAIGLIPSRPEIRR
jgi:hypothetical protein